MLRKKHAPRRSEAIRWKIGYGFAPCDRAAKRWKRLEMVCSSWRSRYFTKIMKSGCKAEELEVEELRSDW